MRQKFLALLLCAIAAPVMAQSAPPGKGAEPQLPDILPLPASEPALDLSAFLKDTSLCIFPFVKDSTDQGGLDRKGLESIQKTFFDVAKESPLLKDAVLLGQATLCDVKDAACFQNVGKLARCQNVLVGASAAKGNGVVLSVRIFDVAKKRVLPGSEVEQVLESEKPAEVQAWAEGQACRALNVKCVGRLQVDADRRDMLLYVDNRVAPRSYQSPEQIGISPGVHSVRVAVGQRTSLEKKVVVRRNGASEVVYARQTEKGGLPLVLASELRGTRPGASVDVQEGKWTKPVGYTLAGAGVLALAVGIYEGQHSKSLISQAETNYRANGVYLSNDISNLNSARSAATIGNVLLVASAVLIASGTVLTFAF